MQWAGSPQRLQAGGSGVPASEGKVSLRWDFHVSGGLQLKKLPFTSRSPDLYACIQTEGSEGDSLHSIPPAPPGGGDRRPSLFT